MTHFVWVIDWIKSGQGFPCLFHWITGLYCPGCGGTRAIGALLQGQLLKSFCYHPFVLFAVIAVMVEMGYFAVGMMCRLRRRKGEKQKDREWEKKAKERFQKRYARWVLAAVWIVGVNWGIKNVFLLMGIDLLKGLEG